MRFAILNKNALKSNKAFVFTDLPIACSFNIQILSPHMVSTYGVSFVLFLQITALYGHFEIIISLFIRVTILKDSER
jgi:hypothetical protein